MRATRALGLAAATGLGLALLALSAYHMTTVGTCGTGPSRFGAQAAAPCPSNTGPWIGALVGSILVAIVVTAVVGAFAGPAFALALGGACLAALATGAANGSWVIAASILAVIFTPIGIVGLWRMRGSFGARLTATLPAVAVGAAAGAAVALAIPGPIREPKHVTWAQIEGVAATSAQSWFEPVNLRRALHTVAGKLGPNAGIASMYLKPGIAVVDAVHAGTMHSFSLRYGNTAEDYTSAASGDHKTVPVGTIDAAAPQRLLGQLRRRFGISAARIDEIDLQLGVLTGTPEWHAHVVNSSIVDFYTSDAHGTGVKPPSG